MVILVIVLFLFILKNESTMLYKKKKEKNESTSFNLLININGRECPKHQLGCFGTLEEELQFVPWLRSRPPCATMKRFSKKTKSRNGDSDFGYSSDEANSSIKVVGIHLFTRKKYFVLNDITSSVSKSNKRKIYMQK